MNTSEVRIPKGKVEAFVKFLEAQYYYVIRGYKDGKYTLGIYRQNESHSLVFKTEDNPNSEYYLYYDSLLATKVLTDTVNRHLGLTLEFTYGQRPSTEITKNKLHTIIKKIMEFKYELSWQEVNRNTVLVIRHPDKVVQEITFIKKYDCLDLISANIHDIKIKEIFDEYSSAKLILSSQYGQLDITSNLAHVVQTKAKTKEQLRLEIDYHLLELHEHIQSNNKDKINKIKEVLTILRSQMMNCKYS